MDWPPKGPDMSPIEHVWAEMVRILDDSPAARNADDLWVQIQNAWDTLCQHQEYWNNLQESMPRRMAAVVAKRGYFTKY